MGHTLPRSAPSRIGRYEIEAPVAEGATSIVYRARDPAIGRTVAIKLLKTGPQVDPEFLARFEREAQSSGTISHPNIVTVYDVGRADGAPYITMEFLNEKSLADIVSSGERLPILQVVALGIQIARALDHAHKHGIVHRDVKPENVLLLDGGKTAKLTDFGIARLTNATELHQTQAGVVLGTPRYMSPEQALGREVDGRSDLFSMGAILYQLLTGKLAFESNNLALLMLQIVQENPVPFGEVAPEVPTGLQRIVMKLLAKRSEQRFQAGYQVVEVLEREHAALIAQNEEAARDSFLPLRAKLAMSAGGILGLLFLFSMTIIYNMQADVLRNAALNSGVNLTRFFAEHSAVPALGQNWLSLRIFIESTRRGRGFDYLVLTDPEHVAQAATDPKLIGHSYEPPVTQNVLESQRDLKVSTMTLPSGPSLFLFDAPIEFQNVAVGHIYLGVDQASVQQVLRTTFWLMAALASIATALVSGLAFFFGLLLMRPIRLMRRTLEQFGRGNLELRISEKRRDEIGEIYRAFNTMADHLQERIVLSEHTDAISGDAPVSIVQPLPFAGPLDATVVAHCAPSDR